MNNKKITEETIYELADIFKIFGDSTRIRILYALNEEEKCVSQLTEELMLNQSAVSHQLRILKDAKLVKGRREGKAIYYMLSDYHVKDILNLGLCHITED